MHRETFFWQELPGPQGVGVPVRPCIHVSQVSAEEDEPRVRPSTVLCCGLEDCQAPLQLLSLSDCRVGHPVIPLLKPCGLLPLYCNW